MNISPCIIIPTSQQSGPLMVVFQEEQSFLNYAVNTVGSLS